MHANQEQSQLKEIVALVGFPNSGKTTLYNWLTSSKFKTVNYPGTTVEYCLGEIADRFQYRSLIMDTPGIYSLFPKSADEEVTKRALYEPQKSGQVTRVIVVIDGTQIEKQIHLVRQIQKAGFGFLIVVTMKDLLDKAQVNLDLDSIKKEFGVSVIQFDGLMALGMDLLLQELQSLKPHLKPKMLNWTIEEQTENIAWARSFSKKIMNRQIEKSNVLNQTLKLDKFLLHPTFGLLIFAVVMTTLFASIYWLATPLMDAFDGAFSWAIGQVKTLLGKSLLSDFVGDGIMASFSAVLIFVPQIFILFFGVGLLEASGYLARAATLIDRPLSKIGLSGRSFVPLLSGFACAVPAMMATRNLSSARDRWITNFIIPLMSCSARLPVYALLLGFIFRKSSPFLPGAFLFLIYLASILVGSVAAKILNSILAKSKTSLFMMELPLYRRPRMRVQLVQAMHRTKSYINRAGPVIFTFAVLLWVGGNFPRQALESSGSQLETSYLGQLGQVIEPVFKPMGVEWRVGVGLISAFAAREVFVSSMAIVFHIADGDEETQSAGLMAAMESAVNRQGELIFTPSSIAGLIVFFMIALQCLSTVGIAVKESNSWKFALSQLVVFNVAAYILAIATVQGLRAMGFA